MATPSEPRHGVGGGAGHDAGARPSDVVNATREDEQNEFTTRMLRGRLWHEAVAVRGARWWSSVASPRLFLGIDPRRSRSTGGCRRAGGGTNTVCNVPTRLVGGSQRKRFVYPEATRGAPSFSGPRCPASVLLVTGGRIGTAAHSKVNRCRPLRAPRNWGRSLRTLGSAFAARVGGGAFLS